MIDTFDPRHYELAQRLAVILNGHPGQANLERAAVLIAQSEQQEGARKWDAGWMAGMRDVRDKNNPPTPNPHGLRRTSPPPSFGGNAPESSVKTASGGGGI